MTRSLALALALFLLCGLLTRPAQGLPLQPRIEISLHTFPPGARVYGPESNDSNDPDGNVEAVTPDCTLPTHWFFEDGNGDVPRDHVSLVFKLAGHHDLPVTITRDDLTTMKKNGHYEWPTNGRTVVLEADTLWAGLQDQWTFRPLFRIALVLLAVATGAALFYVQSVRRRLRRASLLEAQGAGFESRSDYRLGSVVAGYRVQKLLGAGGMAIVYQAVPNDTLNPHDAVAIKFVRAPESEQDGQFIARFEREIRIYQALQHANIVRLIDWGQAGELYIVMELIDGKTLDCALPSPPYDIDTVLKYIIPVGAALTHAHRLDIVHRDLKPQNVMVSKTGQVKVMDFGLARQTRTDRRITKSGTALGTPAYMAPEQIMEKLDAASDQYALGIMTYEFLTAHHPLASGEEAEGMALVMRHLTDAPVGIRTYRPDLPEAVAATVMRMLEKTPEHRFPTVADAIAALSGSRGSSPEADGDARESDRRSGPRS